MLSYRTIPQASSYSLFCTVSPQLSISCKPPLFSSQHSTILCGDLKFLNSRIRRYQQDLVLLLVCVLPQVTNEFSVAM